MNRNKRHWIIGGIVFILSCYLLIKGLEWLWIGVIILFMVYGLVYWRHPQLQWIRQKTLVILPLSFLLTFFLAIGVKMFVLEICLVPSSSMENSIFPGDRLLINKLSYGPRLPRSIGEVPWLNGLHLLSFGRKTHETAVLNGQQKAFTRLKGVVDCKQGDVVVFDSPIEDQLVLVKRVTTKPGDTLVMNKGQLFINGKLMAIPEMGKMDYKLWPKFPLEARYQLDSIGAYFPAYLHKSFPWTLSLSATQHTMLINSPYLDSMKVTDTSVDTSLVFWHQVPTWSLNDFGPFVIPHAGLCIPLDEKHLAQYRVLINRETTSPVAASFEYTFQQDYYFMMGDNRSSSYDSRVWGPIARQQIIGKAILIVGSTNAKQSFWKRFLKSIQ